MARAYCFQRMLYGTKVLLLSDPGHELKAEHSSAGTKRVHWEISLSTSSDTTIKPTNHIVSNGLRAILRERLTSAVSPIQGLAEHSGTF